MLFFLVFFFCLVRGDELVDEIVTRIEREANLAFVGDDEGREAFVAARLFEEAEKIRLKDEWQLLQAQRIQDIFATDNASYVEVRQKNETRPCAAATPEVLCGRIVAPSLAAEDEADEIRTAAEVAMDGLFHQGGVTSMTLDLLDEESFNLATILAERAKDFVEKSFSVTLREAGAMVTRIEEPPREDEFQLNKSHVYWNPHVDKANVVAYDYSALLYLNEYGTDFQGGQLEFFDDRGRRSVVEPAKGLLLAFDSGLYNLHRPRKLTTCGSKRFVLALWFTSAH